MFPFWIRNKNEFPGSSRLARRVLCILATCASSEIVYLIKWKGL